jgi:hypothetical protein
VLVLGVILALVVAAPMAIAAQTAAGSDAQIGKLSAAWWQQVLQEKQPPECGALKQDVIAGDVFYLANFTNPADAKCDVNPSGSYILFPVINWACSPQLSDPFTDEKDLRNECKQLLNYSWQKAKDVKVTVDGQAVEKSDIRCVDSPLFNLTVPQDSFLVGQGSPGVPGTGPAVAYGCWVLLEPLSPGVHTVHIEGKFPLKPRWFGGGPPNTFTQDATYTLTVR